MADNFGLKIGLEGEREFKRRFGNQPLVSGLRLGDEAGGVAVWQERQFLWKALPPNRKS